MRYSSAVVFACCFLPVLLETAEAQKHAVQNSPVSVEYLKADTSSPFPFSDAVRVGDMLYLSGVIGLDKSGKVVPGGIEAEAKQALENIRGVLERNGSSLDRVVKSTVMLADIKEWPAFNAVYKTYFSKNRLPARSAFATSGLALGARVEIECWATVR